MNGRHKNTVVSEAPMKKLLLCALCLVLVFLIGCGIIAPILVFLPEDDTTQPTEARPPVTQAVQPTDPTQGQRDPEAFSALNLSVRQSDGQLSIDRPSLPDRSPMGEDGTWKKISPSELDAGDMLYFVYSGDTLLWILRPKAPEIDFGGGLRIPPYTAYVLKPF